MLHRFQIHLSDVDRGLYDTLDLRVALHPSEAAPYLLTRVLAYALNTQPGLEFTQGLANPDEPALWAKDLIGSLKLWIEIGNPSARRLHKASKASKAVRVYTYKDPAALQKECEGQEIHRRDEIEIFSVPGRVIEALSRSLARDNRWELLHDDGELSVTVAGAAEAAQGTLGRHRLR